MGRGGLVLLGRDDSKDAGDWVLCFALRLIALAPRDTKALDLVRRALTLASSAESSSSPDVQVWCRCLVWLAVRC